MRTKAYGEYYNDCFIIKLNKDLDILNLANSDDIEHFGTFIHEYFHFLQNMTTTFGCISMAVFYAKLLEILHQLGTYTGDKFNRTIKYNKNLQDNFERQNIAVGDMDPWSYEEYDFIAITNIIFERDVVMEEYSDFTLPIIELLLKKNNTFLRKTFNFGAMCIMESMADMLERKIYGQSKTGEYVQYDICEKLWEYILGNTSSPEHIFRFCEYSLMYDNPGQMFFIALRYFKANSLEITEQTIDFFFLEKINPNFIKKYTMWHDEMLRLFKDLVPEHNTYVENLRHYVIEFCDKFYKIRRNQHTFFTKLYLLSPQLAKCKIVEFVKHACPLVINVNNEIYVSNSLDTHKLGMEEYAAFYALYRLMGFNGVRKCVLLDICNANAANIVTEDCYTKPLKSKDRAERCLLGQLLYMWQVKVNTLAEI